MWCDQELAKKAKNLDFVACVASLAPISPLAGFEASAQNYQRPACLHCRNDDNISISDAEQRKTETAARVVVSTEPNSVSRASIRGF